MASDTPSSPRPDRPPSRRTLLFFERALLAIGVGLLAVWGVASLAGGIGARDDLARFAARRDQTAPARRTVVPVASPDLRLWDDVRIRAWRESLLQQAPDPIAVLRIPKIQLEVAVLPGTSDFVLNRAVGHIDETALPGADGNSGIAGHRDGFFRGLKDIAVGDTIHVESLDERTTYRVERIWTVLPEDVWVLDPTPDRALTLVTCYPFYFAGSAPQRYIVRAVREQTALRAQRP